MSLPPEHDYIGLAGGGSSACEDGELNLKETELCLGLPGSSSSESRENSVGLTLGLLLPSKAGAFVAGAKRVFADAIDGAGKWGLSTGGAGSKAEAVKGDVLFSQSREWVRTGALAGGAEGRGGKDAAANLIAAEQENTAGGDQGASAGPRDREMAPVAKAQVVGWPPIRSYRKNTMAANPPKNKDDVDAKQGSGCLYVKVSMEGAPYLRKVDLKTYNSYKELSLALEKMFSCFTIGQCGTHGMSGRDSLSENWLMDLLNGSEYVLTYEDKDRDWMLVGDVPWEMFTNSCRRLRIMKGSDAMGLAPRAMEKCKDRS